MQNQPTNSPMSDKTFMRMMVTSILGIVFSMLALLSTTWAYFSESVNSQSNVIQAGHFVIKTPEIREETSQIALVAEDSVSPMFEAVSNGRNSYQFKETDTTMIHTYAITIAVDDMTVTKGYCSVNIGGKLYRHAFSKDKTSVTFYVTVTGDDVISIEAYWSLQDDLETGAELPINKASEPIKTPEAETLLSQANTLLEQVSSIAEKTEEMAISVRNEANQSINSALEASAMPTSSSADTSQYMLALQASVEQATQIVYDAEKSSSIVQELRVDAQTAVLTANLTELQRILSSAQAEQTKVSEAASKAKSISAQIKATITAIEVARSLASESTVVSVAESTVVPVKQSEPETAQSSGTKSEIIISESTVVPTKVSAP